MKPILSLASFVLAISAMAGVAVGAGRGGFGESAAPSSGSAPTGSNGFRSADPPPAPPAFSRAPNPVAPQRPPVFEERHAPAGSGSAGTLPGANAPFRPPAANQFREVPSSTPPPAQPARRAEQRQDFLGLHNDRPGTHPGTPIRVPTPPPSPSTTFNGNAIVTPGASFHEGARHAPLPNPPGKPERPTPPPVPERWKSANDHYSDQFNRWARANAAYLATFQSNRSTSWNQVRQRQSGAAWRGQYASSQYHQWRHGVWDYRRARAEEIWDRTQYLHENLFDRHWWATCWWRHRPWDGVANVSPWWWWNPVSWADETVFFGADLGADPVTYDPGANVFYDGDNYDVDGRDNGSATDARDRAIALGNPQIEEIPVPEPAPEGQPQQWLPLGAWALTQQEQGDPILFFQLSVDRGGIVAGGYKNALSGEEQPIVGQLDKRRQRIAWHIANAPTTVFETGLSSLDYDVASVFVHFSGPQAQTQTWLLVRLPSPEMPPGSVRMPNDSN